MDRLKPLDRLISRRRSNFHKSALRGALFLYEVTTAGMSRWRD